MKKAEATRLTILQKAFELVYSRGYQTTSIDDILASTKVTKGAFYYHFNNKDEMGIAIIEEVMKPALTESVLQHMLGEENPLEAIYNLIYHLLIENEFLKVEYGCPAANLAQEMSPWNSDFSAAINEITHQWMKALTTALEKGKKTGFVSKDVNVRQVTMFIMSGYWGVRNFGKLENTKQAYLLYLKGLKSYLNTLK